MFNKLILLYILFIKLSYVIECLETIKESDGQTDLRTKEQTVKANHLSTKRISNLKNDQLSKQTASSHILLVKDRTDLNSENFTSYSEGSRVISKPILVRRIKVEKSDRLFKTGQMKANSNEIDTSLNSKNDAPTNRTAFDSTNDQEMFKLIQKNQTLIHHLVERFNNLTEDRIRLMKRSQRRLIQNLNNFINNQHRNLLIKFNQTKLNHLFDFEKELNKTGETEDKISSVRVINSDPKDQPVNSTEQGIDNGNDTAINKNSNLTIMNSQSKSNYSDCDCDCKGSQTTNSDCDCDCHKTTKFESSTETPLNKSTPEKEQKSWKQIEQQLIVKKSKNFSNRTSLANSIIDLDSKSKQNRTSSKNLKSIFKKGKLMVAPRYSAKQTMQTGGQQVSNTTNQSNYPDPNSLNTILPTCTLLDLFCWFYRYSRFLFIVRY